MFIRRPFVASSGADVEAGSTGVGSVAELSAPGELISCVRAALPPELGEALGRGELAVAVLEQVLSTVERDAEGAPVPVRLRLRVSGRGAEHLLVVDGRLGPNRRVQYRVVEDRAQAPGPRDPRV